MLRFIPRIRPASDFEIKPRRTLLARFRDFWTHETIDAMQARMLRDIPAIHEHRKAARRQAHSLQTIEAATRRLADGLYGVGRDNWIGSNGGSGGRNPRDSSGAGGGFFEPRILYFSHGGPGK